MKIITILVVVLAACGTTYAQHSDHPKGPDGKIAPAVWTPECCENLLSRHSQDDNGDDDLALLRRLNVDRSHTSGFRFDPDDYILSHDYNTAFATCWSEYSSEWFRAISSSGMYGYTTHIGNS